MVFLGHSTKDEIITKQIVNYLELNGIQCCIAPRDIRPGMEFEEELMHAIRGCDAFVLVASENANQSKHVINEVRNAFNFNKRIYPFMIENYVFSDKYEYYLAGIHRIDAYTNFEDGLKALLNALDKANQPINEEQVKKKKVTSSIIQRTEEIRIATYQDLIATGMTALDISRRCVENDYKLYPKIAVENEGTPEQWAEFLSAFPEATRYLVEGENTIIGDWFLLAVSEAIHAEKLARGELQEATFSPDEMEYFLLPGNYIGYLLNLSVNEGYNNARNYRMLLHSFGEQLVNFAKNGIFFKEWYVNVFRKDHEAMYKSLGFRFYLNNITCGKLYKLECNPFSKNTLFANSKELMELYDEHFV